jgi:hypothetical protein
VETGTAWCLPCCRGACCLFLPAKYGTSACWYFCWYRQQSMAKACVNSDIYGIKRLSARGTSRAFALIRQRSFSSITTAISCIFSCAAVRPLFAGIRLARILVGRSQGCWYRNLGESYPCRPRMTPILGT